MWIFVARIHSEPHIQHMQIRLDPTNEQDLMAHATVNRRSVTVEANVAIAARMAQLPLPKPAKPTKGKKP